MEDLVKREFYSQYMEPMGALYALAVDVREPGGLEARLRAARPRGGEDFGEAEKVLCRRLAPDRARPPDPAQCRQPRVSVRCSLALL